MNEFQRFISWYESQYGQAFPAYLWAVYKTLPQYQWWRDNVETSAQQADPLSQMSQYLQNALNASSMTEKQATDLYNKYANSSDPLGGLLFDPKFRAFAGEANLQLPDYLDYIGVSPEIKDYVNQYTSEADLADRLNNLNIDDNSKLSLYNNILSTRDSSEAEIRKSKADALAEQEKAQSENDVNRVERATTLIQALDATLNNPIIQKDDLKGLNKASTDDYLSGKSNELLQRLVNINKTAQQRSTNEAQRSNALLGGMNQPKAETRANIPAMPTLESVINPYLKSTGLGQGTRLRSYIESNIPDIVQQTAGARQSWWERMNTPVSEEPTFESETNRLTREGNTWGRIAATGPTSDYAGDTYYGKGGVAGIARNAQAYVQQTLAGLRPEQFTTTAITPKASEDPLLKKLRERQFRTEYYRQPGTGLGGRLTPSLRFR